MKTYSVILILLFGSVSFAQNPNNFNIYISSPERPIVVINSDIIANVDVLVKAQGKDNMHLYLARDAELSSKNLFPMDKNANGIIRVEMDIDIEVKTQSELNAFFGLNAENDIYVNGYLLEDKQQKISTKSIKNIELREPDGLILKSPALNITIE